jgi:hypothetical protein
MFNDISGSVLTEQALKRRAYPCVVDIAPRALGAGCVYIVRTEAQTRDDLASILDEAEIGWTNIIQDEQ